MEKEVEVEEEEEERMGLKKKSSAVIHIIPRRKENYALVFQFKGKSTFSTSKELICGIITID